MAWKAPLPNLKMEATIHLQASVNAGRRPVTARSSDFSRIARCLDLYVGFQIINIHIFKR